MKLKSNFILTLALFTICSSTFSQTKNTSLYTSLNPADCTESVESEGAVLLNCPGLNGIKILVINGDYESYIEVVSADGKKVSEIRPPIEDTDYNYIGQKKLEWRFNDKKELIGFIVRSEHISYDPFEDMVDNVEKKINQLNSYAYNSSGDTKVCFIKSARDNISARRNLDNNKSKCD